ncbi:RHS repeat-associated core domain-containing protein [Trinickia mobilis]|uniref:RHS repeat-associated core domain-containing protein n=1 Tax=Trinickia mobilis TaxID=2816356 RepID=UPI002867E8C3|nr:RHS repeat-associated core domain-containing protein [Trinickia mobilis]
MRDNRGLTVRTVAYNRSAPDEPRDTRISRQQFDAAGQLLSQTDARLAAPNLRTVHTLSGQPLRSDSVDAGLRLALADVAGRPLWAADGNGQQRRRQHDALGRPLAVQEQRGDAPAQCRERYAYGEDAPDAAAHNLRGQLWRHDDPAGRRALAGYGLHGQPLADSRRFLAALDAPDWPEEAAASEALLEPGAGYATRWDYDAFGAVIGELDAVGHRRRNAYDRAGLLKGRWLQLAAGVVAEAEQIVLTEPSYNAGGQLLASRAGNGVRRDYRYEPATSRLAALRSVRERDGVVLQDLGYQYDPVGNVTRIEDGTQPVRHHANQRIDPVRAYRYDALYQLLEASGPESAQAGQQGPGLPPLQVGDDGQLANYVRQYRYDRGGNLEAIVHAGAQRYTLEMLVSPRSNRAVAKRPGVMPGDVDGCFDANGNVRELQPGQPLAWDERNQLQRTVQTEHADGPADDERYIYDGGGQRVRKVRSWRAGSQTHREEVRYLPGLEWRETSQSDISGGGRKINESLQVVTADGGLRVLHWEAGQPSGIGNDQARYSLDDQLGSSVLELDGSGQKISREEYFPFGGTALRAARSESEAKYKTVRYSGKERDGTGLYYYGYRYYAPWLGRWLNPDPAGSVDGLNLFRMVRNNPLRFKDNAGLNATDGKAGGKLFKDAKSLGMKRLDQAQKFLKEPKNRQNALRIGKIFFGSTLEESYLGKWSENIASVHSALDKLKTSKNIDYLQAKSGKASVVAELNMDAYGRDDRNKRKYVNVYTAKIAEIQGTSHLGPEHVAHVAIHELSHGALKTDDHEYIGVMAQPGFHDLTKLASLPMLDQEMPGVPLTLAERQAKANKINQSKENADSFTVATRYLAYAQDKPEFVGQLTDAYDAWLKGGKQQPLLLKMEGWY